MWTYAAGKAGLRTGDAPDRDGRAQAYLDRVLPGLAATRALDRAQSLIAAGDPAAALAVLEHHLKEAV